MFREKVSLMMDHRRKHEDFPSPNHMKQLKDCWIERINTLKGLLNQLKELSQNNIEAYSNIIGLHIIGTTIDVSDPSIMSNSILMIREKFKKKIENLKKSLGGNFYRMIEYTYDDINSWLVE